MSDHGEFVDIELRTRSSPVHRAARIHDRVADHVGVTFVVVGAVHIRLLERQFDKQRCDAARGQRLRFLHKHGALNLRAFAVQPQHGRMLRLRLFDRRDHRDFNLTARCARKPPFGDVATSRLTKNAAGDGGNGCRLRVVKQLRAFGRCFFGPRGATRRRNY